MQNEPMTLQQISDIEGVSKQRVAEILENALRKMRIVLQKRGIKMENLHHNSSPSRPSSLATIRHLVLNGFPCCIHLSPFCL